MNRKSILGIAFHEILCLAERIGSIRCDPSKLGDPAVNYQDLQAVKDHKMIPLTASKVGAGKLVKVLKKALKITDNQLSNAPELEYYRKNHGNSNAYILYCKQINRLIEFLKGGAFLCRLAEKRDFQNVALTIQTINQDSAI